MHLYNLHKIKWQLRVSEKNPPKHIIKEMQKIKIKTNYLEKQNYSYLQERIRMLNIRIHLKASSKLIDTTNQVEAIILNVEGLCFNYHHYSAKILISCTWDSFH